MAYDQWLAEGGFTQGAPFGAGGFSSQNSPFIPNFYAPAKGNAFGYLGAIPNIPNPAFSSGFGGQQVQQQGFGGGNVGSLGDIFGSVSGGGNINFGGDAKGINPYQFMPAFQQFQRPDSPVAGLTPEEEYLRQFAMGQLLGPQEGQATAMEELLKTVSGEYLYQDSNPYITDQINSLGALSADKLNESINQILSRAGVSGALGGSRAALMQGEAAGETTRGFNETIANLLSGNYQRERQNQLGAIPGLLNTEQLPIQQSLQAMGLAGIPREMQQKLIDAQMSEWQRMQSERMLPIQVGQSILGQRMGQPIPIVQPQSSPLAGLGSLFSGAGSLASGLGSMGNLFSNFWGGGGSDPFDWGGMDDLSGMGY